MSSTYELIFEGIRDTQPQTLQQVKAALIADLNFSVDQVKGLLSGKETRILESKDSLALSMPYELLKKSGAKVSIIEKKLPDIDTVEVSLSTLALEDSYSEPLFPKVVPAERLIASEEKVIFDDLHIDITAPIPELQHTQANKVPESAEHDLSIKFDEGTSSLPSPPPLEPVQKVVAPVQAKAPTTKRVQPSPPAPNPDASFSFSLEEIPAPSPKKTEPPVQSIQTKVQEAKEEVKKVTTAALEFELSLEEPSTPSSSKAVQPAPIPTDAPQKVSASEPLPPTFALGLEEPNAEPSKNAATSPLLIEKKSAPEAPAPINLSIEGPIEAIVATPEIQKAPTSTPASISPPLAASTPSSKLQTDVPTPSAPIISPETSMPPLSQVTVAPLGAPASPAVKPHEPTSEEKKTSPSPGSSRQKKSSSGNVGIFLAGIVLLVIGNVVYKSFSEPATNYEALIGQSLISAAKPPKTEKPSGKKDLGPSDKIYVPPTQFTQLEAAKDNKSFTGMLSFSEDKLSGKFEFTDSTQYVPDIERIKARLTPEPIISKIFVEFGDLVASPYSKTFHWTGPAAVNITVGEFKTRRAASTEFTGNIEGDKFIGVLSIALNEATVVGEPIPPTTSADGQISFRITKNIVAPKVVPAPEIDPQAVLKEEGTPPVAPQ